MLLKAAGCIVSYWFEQMNYTYKKIWLIAFPVMMSILIEQLVAFENPKGGVGKSTLTALFAGYIHSQSNEEGGLSIAVVDIDDMQNTIGNYVRTKPRTES